MKVKTLVSKIRNLGVVNGGKKQGIAIIVDLANGAYVGLSQAKIKTSATKPYGYGIDETFKDELYLWNVTNFGQMVEKEYKKIPDLEVIKFRYCTINNEYQIFVKDNDIINIAQGII